MYQKLITTTDKAVCHLFIHCCFKDDAFVEAEVDEVAEKFVALDMQKGLDFKEEVKHYKSYKANITDEKEYLHYLVKLIHPANETALYSYCLELGVSDSVLDPAEEKLFETLGNILGLSQEEQSIIQKLMVQREVVRANKFF